MKRPGRNRWTLVLMGVVLVASRGCVIGTDTGNAMCAPPDPCLMPASIIGPEATEWRATMTYGDADSSSSIVFRGEGITTDSGTCERASPRPSAIRGTIPLHAEESSSDASGALHVQFEDPRLGFRWVSRRPQISVGRQPGDFYAAHAMDLVVSPDGAITATLAVVHSHVLADGSIQEDDAGIVTIEGLLSVVCPSGEEIREIPVSSGDAARIRCGIVDWPQPECDDTVDSSFGCSMAGLARRR